MPLPRNSSDLWDEEAEKKSFARTMFPFLLLGFRTGARNTSRRKPAPDLLTSYRRQAFESKSARYAAETVGTTAKALQREIDAAIAAGESVPQLANRINDLFGRSMGYRSVRIARTQITNTVNDGALATLANEGQPTKEWSTVIDGRERETHHAAHGQVVGIHEQFHVGGFPCRYPGDDALPPSESANCRCTLVAGGLPEGAKARLGQSFLRAHGTIERRYVLSLRAAFRAQRDRLTSRLTS